MSASDYNCIYIYICTTCIYTYIYLYSMDTHIIGKVAYFFMTILVLVLVLDFVQFRSLSLD